MVKFVSTFLKEKKFFGSHGLQSWIFPNGVDVIFAAMYN
jgi:hypothetical protein